MDMGRSLNNVDSISSKTIAPNSLITCCELAQSPNDTPLFCLVAMSGSVTIA